MGQIRRERVLRAARNQRRADAAFGLAACTALIALAALAYGDFEAATLIGLMACLVFGMTYVAWKVGRKKVADVLLDIDHPT